MTHGQTGSHLAQASASLSVDRAPSGAGGAVGSRLDVPPPRIHPDGFVPDRGPTQEGVQLALGLPLCSEALSTDAQCRIAQLLGDAARHLISAGLDLASVDARLPRTHDHAALEHATSNLDTALVDIRSLAAQIALGAYPPVREAPTDHEPE